MCAVVLSLFHSATSLARDMTSLPEAMSEFTLQLSSLDKDVIVLRYPLPFLLSSSQYPNLQAVTWPQLQTLWKMASSCHFPVKNSNAEPAPLFAKAVEFERHLCHDTLMNDEWFTKGDWQHPAGGSYAERYLRYLQTRFGEQSVEASDFIERFKDSHFTLMNPAHPLYADFAPLSERGRDALLQGERFWLDERNQIWMNTEPGVIQVEAQQWLPFAKALSIEITALQNSTVSCQMKYGNLCVNRIERYQGYQTWGLLLLTCICCGLAGRYWHERQQEAKERRFILQLLTHELRTPIASLGFTVEQFRRQFDELPKLSQMSAGRLFADHQRLDQLTETSRSFLSSDPSERFAKQSALISEWLDYSLEKYSLSYQLEQDIELELPYYWLSVCLDNLIRNALTHGKGQVSVAVDIGASAVRIRVSDQGEFPSVWQRWLGHKSARKRQDNMGIGLTLVARLMKKMGGRLIIKRQPTQLILELPR